MRKTLVLCLVIIMMVVLSSCSMSESGPIDRLASPDNLTPPIQGKWVLSDYIDPFNTGNKEEEENMLGKEGLFHKEAVILGFDYTTNPSYKVKTVKALDYLIYKYKLNPEDLNIDKEEITIITILSDNQYFNDFIQVEEDLFIVNIDNRFYILEQLAQQVSIEETLRYIDIEKAMIRDSNTIDAEKRETGLLLGLKYPTYDSINELPSWEYETLWIRSNDGTILEVYQLDSLLVPRKKGFWEIGVERQVDKDHITDLIITSPKKEAQMEANRNNTSRVANFNSYDPTSVLKNIVFVGNNYISIEEIISRNDDRKILKTFSLDNLQNENPIKLSDLVGESGKELFMEGVQKVMSLDEAPSINEANIGLSRNKGHWIFNGRINYVQNEKELFKDFNIRAIPPKDIINYDENLIPWEAIKRRIPDAIDMFFSPNKDFVVIMTNYNIQVFNIENNDSISQVPLAKVNLPKNASTVMSEWALGRYVDTWENEIIIRGGKTIEE